MTDGNSNRVLIWLVVLVVVLSVAFTWQALNESPDASEESTQASTTSSAPSEPYVNTEVIGAGSVGVNKLPKEDV